MQEDCPDQASLFKCNFCHKHNALAGNCKVFVVATTSTTVTLLVRLQLSHSAVCSLLLTLVVMTANLCSLRMRLQSDAGLVTVYGACNICSSGIWVAQQNISLSSTWFVFNHAKVTEHSTLGLPHSLWQHALSVHASCACCTANRTYASLKHIPSLLLLFPHGKCACSTGKTVASQQPQLLSQLPSPLALLLVTS